MRHGGTGVGKLRRHLAGPSIIGAANVGWVGVIASDSINYYRGFEASGCAVEVNWAGFGKIWEVATIHLT